MTEIIEYFKILAERIGLIFERLSEFGGEDLLKTLNLNVATNLEISDEDKTPIISLVIGQKWEGDIRIIMFVRNKYNWLVDAFDCHHIQ